MKSRNGIALISLVITIIVLIILAGVAINLTLGENGIFKRAEETKQRESESSARERLELILVDARIEKETNASYNSEDYLTQMLEEENITVSGDNVIVDNYNFVIDREKLEILESLGETQIKVTAEVQEYLGKNENDKYVVSMLLVIESNTGLQSVVIQNPDGTTFEIETEKAILGKDMEVELDEEYILTVTTKDGTTETRKIVEKSVENIRTAEELAAFRDKVNTGLTYEGKTINVVKDLDLSNVCGENVGSWEPIGTTVYFKGTFEGNEHKISNLYINTGDYTNLGLFSGSMGIIQNLIMENIYVYNSRNITSANTYTGGIVGRASNTTISNCSIESGSVLGITTTSASGAYYWTKVGGIVGQATSSTTIECCYNKAEVQSKTGTGSTSCATAGGICGQLYQSTVINCYNTGTIYAYSHDVAMAGIVGYSENQTTTYNYITNCYNKGTISGSGTRRNRPAGIVAKNGWDTTSNTTITNCYCLDNVLYSYYYNSARTSTIGRVDKDTLQNCASTLGDAFTDDVKIKVINEETGVEEEEWSNEGYPILKWQIGE